MKVREVLKTSLGFWLIYIYEYMMVPLIRKRDTESNEVGIENSEFSFGHIEFAVLLRP